MYPASLDINSATHAKGLLSRPLVSRIRNGKSAAADQVRREASMGVGGVVCVAAPVLCQLFGSREMGDGMVD